MWTDRGFAPRGRGLSRGAAEDSPPGGGVIAAFPRNRAVNRIRRGGTNSAREGDAKEREMFTQILVPTDFSPQADAALAEARALAAEFGATLHVLHIFENVFLRAVVGNPRDLEAAAQRQLDERLTPEDLRRGAVAALETSDEPAKEIVQYARETGIDLIVMGTHGRTGLPHVLLGSIAEHVVRTAPCPVLTLRNRTHRQRGADHVQPHSRTDGFQRAV
jgi:nucleotide-binding universal stress UspA family protein